MSEDFADIVGLVERLLADSLGGPVRLDQIRRVTDPGRSNEILRCHLASAPHGAPPTVLFKRRRGFRPDAYDDWGTLAVYRNWAGLQLLTELRVGVAARFYGGSRDGGLVAMEDFGPPHSLADVLLRGDAAEAEQGLLLLATALGRMHAATVGRESDYARVRDPLGPGDGPSRRAKDADELRAAARTLAERCAALGVTPPPGFEAVVAAVAEAIADPGPFLAFTHGDPCPDNNTILQTDRGPELRLFDFDIGAYRHALLDGAYGRIRFPTCWCVRDLDDRIVDRMDAAYRAELVKGCPAAADDAAYARATVEACAAWVITHAGWHLERALDFDGMWGESSIRQRFLMRLPIFVHLARRAGHLDALADAAESLHAALERRWRHVTAPIGTYPAFTRATDPPAQAVTDLTLAIGEGDLACARALLDEWPALANARSPSADQQPVLLCAIQRDDAAMVALLLERGADWRVRARSGTGNLVVAARGASPEVVALLLRHGADPNTPGGHGFLPLSAAAKARRAENVRLLLEHGTHLDVFSAVYLDRSADVERLLGERPSLARHAFGDGTNALLVIASFDDTAARYIPLFVRHGADPNAGTWGGTTPLHAAARAGNLEVARALLTAGAMPDAATREGDTALSLAEANGHPAVADLLHAVLSQAPAA